MAALDSNMKLGAPHSTWEDWHNLGTAYWNLGLMWGNERDRQNKALIAFRQSLQRNPRNGEGWNSLGATYQTLSNYDEALGNAYARQNYDNLQAALAAAAAAAAAHRESSSSSNSAIELYRTAKQVRVALDYIAVYEETHHGNESIVRECRLQGV